MTSVLLEFSMFPTDKGESVSEYVSKIIKMIDESGFAYKLTPMGTIIETTSMSDAMEIVQKAYACLEPYSNRVYSSIKLDIQKNRQNRMHSKVASIKQKIGDVNS
jgi:uncharacterized protein (TIGR00106 family)